MAGILSEEADELPFLVEGRLALGSLSRAEE